MTSVVATRRVYDLPYIAEAPRVYSYIDLRTHPAKLNEIPELKREPVLKSLVSVLIDPRGCFMTHGCAVASRRPGTGTAIPIPVCAERALCWYTSYVAISFWVLDQNKEEHYRAIHHAYPFDRTDCNICFEIQAVYFWTPDEQRQDMKWSDTNGTACMIWASGWGDTAKEARDKWSTAIQDLIAFFTNRQTDQGE